MSKRVQHAVPTMLRYPALKSFDRLAGACKCWINNVAIFRVEMLDRNFAILACSVAISPHSTSCIIHTYFIQTEAVKRLEKGLTMD